MKCNAQFSDQKMKTQPDCSHSSAMVVNTLSTFAAEYSTYMNPYVEYRKSQEFSRPYETPMSSKMKMRKQALVYR